MAARCSPRWHAALQRPGPDGLDERDAAASSRLCGRDETPARRCDASGRRDDRDLHDPRVCRRPTFSAGPAAWRATHSCPPPHGVGDVVPMTRGSAAEPDGRVSAAVLAFLVCSTALAIWWNAGRTPDVRRDRRAGVGAVQRRAVVDLRGAAGAREGPLRGRRRAGDRDRRRQGDRRPVHRGRGGPRLPGQRRHPRRRAARRPGGRRHPGEHAGGGGGVRRARLAQRRPGDRPVARDARRADGARTPASRRRARRPARARPCRPAPPSSATSCGRLLPTCSTARPAQSVAGAPGIG